MMLTACDRVVAEAPGVNPLGSHAAWTRTADSGATAAVYFMLTNRGAVADTLKGVSSDAAATTGMHVSMQHSRIMQMAPVTELPVPAEDSVAFQPLGAHVMLTGLRRSLVEGDTVAVTLEFASGRKFDVRAGVRRP